MEKEVEKWELYLVFAWRKRRIRGVEPIPLHRQMFGDVAIAYTQSRLKNYQLFFFFEKEKLPTFFFVFLK